MTRQQELLRQLVDSELKPHRLVNVAGRFSQDTVVQYQISNIPGKYTWNSYPMHAMQRIGIQRVSQVNEAVDFAQIAYELNAYTGVHTRREKVAGAQFYIENVPAGATVTIRGTTGYDSSSAQDTHDLYTGPITEGLNKITFNEVEVTYFQFEFTGLAGQIQYLRYAVPLGYEDNVDTIPYNQVTPTVQSGKNPVPMSQIRSFKFNNEQFSQEHIGGASNVRNPQDGISASFEQQNCSFSVYTDSWTLADERLVCGIKLRASADLIASLTIVAWGYQPYNPTVLADKVEFLQEIVLWFPPTPACELDFRFEFAQPLSGIPPAQRMLEHMETYCVIIPGETEEPLTPVTLESITGVVPVVSPSVSSAINVKPVGKAQGISTTNCALSSQGSTVTADEGTDPDCPPSNAIDDNINTDWISWGTWGELRVDFNMERLLAKVVVEVEYIETTFVIEALTPEGVWVTVHEQLTYLQGYWGTVTSEFEPLLATAIRYRCTEASQNAIHAIYELEAYEADFIDAPMPVSLALIGQADLAYQSVDADMDQLVSSSLAWKVTLIGLKFSTTDLKDYKIALKHVPSWIEYTFREQKNTDETDFVITEPLLLSSDFEIRVVTAGVLAGNRVDLIVSKEDRT